MAIVRYNPWAEMSAMQRQIDRIFEDLQVPAFRTPAAELTETEDALHLKLELPGVSAKDVDIEVTQDAVKVIAERKEEHQEGTRSEFYYGKFQRVIPLNFRKNVMQVQNQVLDEWEKVVIKEAEKADIS